MELDALIPSTSKYLKKDDVPASGKNVTVKGFKKETIKGDNGEEEKIVLYFEEFEKGLVLNRTNLERLKIATGAQTTQEVKGKVVNLYNDKFVEFGGKIVGGLRIREKSDAETASLEAVSESIDDDIPF